MNNPQNVRPDPSEYAPAAADYVARVPDGNILDILATQRDEFLQLLRPCPEPESLVHHAPYTWSIRQVVGHLCDSERVFAYRALRLAHNDPKPLERFHENAWMQEADFDRWPLADHLAEFELIRNTTLSLFNRLSEPAWLHRGTVIGHPATARGVAYVTAGHAKHHLDIIRKRLAP